MVGGNEGEMGMEDEIDDDLWGRLMYFEWALMGKWFGHRFPISWD